MSRLRVALVAVAVLAACAAEDDGGSQAERSSTTTASVLDADRYRREVFADVDVVRDIVYGAAPGRDGGSEDLRLDLYRPAGDDEVARPAVLFVHGGGFAFGDKAHGVAPMLASDFAELGYVTASVNYRLLAPGGCSGSSPGGGSCVDAALAGIHDAQAAVRWLRAVADAYGVDPGRIAIAGESAGGVIAYGVGTWSDVPGDSGTPGVSSAVQAWMSLSGGAPDGPFADAGDAPGILFASTGDPVVPHQWSVDCRDTLTAAGVAVELVSYDLDVHVPFREQRDDIVRRTIDFFHEHLDLAAR